MRGVIPFFREAGMAVMDLIYPSVCPGCGKGVSPGDPLVCVSCKERMTRLAPPFCPQCGAPTVKGKPLRRCRECLEGAIYFDRARSVFSYYDPIVRRCIHAFKFEYQSRLAAELGALMVEVFEPIRRKTLFDAIVPVPLHASRRREREYNQSALLAQVIAQSFGVPVREDWVRKTRKTKPQNELTREERLANLAGAFEPVSPRAAEGMRIMLVDDIVTTGSTVNQVSEALRRAGARFIYVASLARAVEAEIP